MANFLQKIVSWLTGRDNTVATNYVGKSLSNVKDVDAPASNIFNSLINKYTDSGATGRDVAINEMNRQNIVDQASLEVQGYKKAGLNPALMYGAGTSSSPTVSNSSAGGLQDLVGLLTLPAQLRNIDASTDKMRKEAATEDEHRKQVIETTNNLKAQYKEILARTDLTDSQREMLVTQSQYIDRLQDAAIRQAEADIRLTNSQRKRIDELLSGEKLLQQRSAENYLKVWKKIEAEIGKISADTKLSERDLEDYALNRVNTGIVADLFRAFLESKQDKDGDGYRDRDKDGDGYRDRDKDGDGYRDRDKK